MSDLPYKKLVLWCECGWVRTGRFVQWGWVRQMFHQLTRHWGAK